MEDQYPFLRRPYVSEEDKVNEIKQLLKILPEWVKPHMVFAESSIEATKEIGKGQYGKVQQGTFRHGNAV